MARSNAYPVPAPSPPVPARRRTVVDCLAGAPPRIDAAGNAEWFVRAAHFGVLMTCIERETTFAHTAPGESMIVSAAGLHVSVETNGQQACSRGDALFIVPPGESRIRASGRGLLARIVGAEATSLLEAADNAADYRNPAAELAPFAAWPAPVGGFRLQHYHLSDYVDATQPGRAFRCTNLMVNITDIYPGQRDSRRLKPHWHDDFEQITLTCAGRFAHHLRTPWGIDSTQWRADEHLEIGSPAALVLPAGLIHTSQAMEAGCWLVDIFGPPREDFSRMDGFVRNAERYPMRERVGDDPRSPAPG